LNKKLAQGTLTTIDNQIDQTTGTVKLRAVFDNQKDSLFPNQFVNVRLLVEEKSGVTLVPNAAVQINSLSTYVYLVQPDRTVTVRQVTPGTAEGDRTQIVTGLSPGAVVVTEGVDKLQEGTKVTPRISGENEADASGGAPGKPSGVGVVPSKGHLQQGANSPKAR
jgi:membrane fusion protein, multidrug efflux system